MKFQIKLEVIKDYLKRLSTSVQSISSRIEFTGVFINVWDNSITFEGRNDWMDTKIDETSLTNIKIIKTGKILVKAQILNEIIQKMEGKFVTFNKVDQNILTIEDSNSNYHINLLSDENYEVSKFISQTQQEINIPSSIFRKAIAKTEFSGNEFHNKFIYQGINLNISNEKLTATVCDGVRISSWSTIISSNVKINKIIPLKVARELIKILPTVNEYKLSFFNNKCLLVSENMINQFTLIEGHFPTFDKFFNTELYNKKLSISKDVILNTIDRVTILTKVFDGARIGLSINNESFIIESKEEIGSAKIKIKDYDYSGEFIDISISPKMISDGIKHIETNKINIFFIDSKSSVLIKSNDEFLYLISPMI